jgi:hypothetical protein
MTDHPNSMNPRGGPPGRDIFTSNGGQLMTTMNAFHRSYFRLPLTPSSINLTTSSKPQRFVLRFQRRVYQL